MIRWMAFAALGLLSASALADGGAGIPCCQSPMSITVSVSCAESEAKVDFVAAVMPIGIVHSLEIPEAVKQLPCANEFLNVSMGGPVYPGILSGSNLVWFDPGNSAGLAIANEVVRLRALTTTLADRMEKLQTENARSISEVPAAVLSDPAFKRELNVAVRQALTEFNQ